MILSDYKFLLSVAFVVCSVSGMQAIHTGDEEIMGESPAVGCKPGKRVRFAPLPVFDRPQGRRIPRHKVPKQAKCSEDKSEGGWRSKVWSSMKDQPGYYVLGGTLFVGAGLTILQKYSDAFRRKVSNPLVAKLKSFVESLKTKRDCSSPVKDTNEDDNDICEN